MRDILPGPPSLRLGLGIGQGDIAVGSFSGRRPTDYTVLGLGVRFATRLEAMCPPGFILMSDSVFAQPRPPPDAREM